jgi:hypothetical protein
MLVNRLARDSPAEPRQRLGAILAVLVQSRAGRSALLPRCRAANDPCGHKQHAHPGGDHPP